MAAGQRHRPEKIELISRVIVGRLADKREVARQHADNGIWGAIQRYCLAHDIGATAKVLLPRSVTEDHDVVPPGTVLFGEEVAAELHARAEEREEVRRHIGAGETLRLARAIQYKVGYASIATIFVNERLCSRQS